MGVFGWKLCLFLPLAIGEILYIVLRVRFGPNIIAGHREYRRARTGATIQGSAGKGSRRRPDRGLLGNLPPGL
jgi:hypothetical protein